MKKEVQYNYISLFRELFSRIPKHRRKQFWLLCCGMFCSAIMETATLGVIALFASTVSDPDVVMNSKYIAYVRELVNAPFLSSAKGMIASAALLVVLIVAVKNAFKANIKYWISRYCAALEAFFGKFLINGLLHLPYEWHVSQNSADIVNVIAWRVYMGRQFFIPFIQICNDILLMSIMLFALVAVQPLVSFAVILVIGGTAYFIYIIIRTRLDKIATLARDYDVAINREATMAIHGVKDVKISSKEQSFVKIFSDNAIPLAKIVGLQQFYTGAPVLILEFTGFALLSGSICMMLFVTNSSTAAITGTMALLAVTAWKVFPAVTRVVGGFANIRNAMPYLSNQLEHISMIESNRLKEVTDSEYQEDDLDIPDKIIFRNVSFKYNNSKDFVINNLNFSIQKGKATGIIGISGAGKSTLVDLFAGLLEPSIGKIMLDGTALTKANQHLWVQKIGYVPQFPYIYDGTLAENVAFGCKTKYIDMDKVIECCQKAAMEDFLNELPGHIEAFIGERGVKLSGGQQQRVAIARALYTDPEILILDEATSSLDDKNEKAIQETIRRLQKRLTLIIISHRLSTVKDCDFFIWLEKGRIKMQGEDQEILKKYKYIR